MKRRECLKYGVPLISFPLAGCNSTDTASNRTRQRFEITETLVSESAPSTGVTTHEISVESGQSVGFEFVGEKWAYPGAYAFYKKRNPVKCVSSSGSDVKATSGTGAEDAMHKFTVNTGGNYVFKHFCFDQRSIPSYIGRSDSYSLMNELEYKIYSIESTDTKTVTTQLHDYYTSGSVDFDDYRDAIEVETTDLEQDVASVESPEDIHQHGLLLDASIQEPMWARISNEILSSFDQPDAETIREIQSLYRKRIIRLRAILAFYHTSLWLKDRVQTSNRVASEIVAEVIAIKLGLGEDMKETVQSRIETYLDENTGALVAVPEATSEPEFEMDVEIVGSIDVDWTDTYERIRFDVPVDLIVSVPYDIPFDPPITSSISGVEVGRDLATVTWS